MRLLLICALALSEVGPLRADRDLDDYVHELLSPGPTTRTADGWPGADVVVPDAELTQLLRQSPGAPEQSVRAVAFLNVGFHPRWTLVFKGPDDELEVIATMMFWGDVTLKKHGRVSLGQFRAFVGAAGKALRCSAEPDETHHFAGFAQWAPEEPLYCRADAFSEGHQSFSDTVMELLEDCATTYSRPGD